MSVSRHVAFVVDFALHGDQAWHLAALVRHALPCYFGLKALEGCSCEGGSEEIVDDGGIALTERLRYGGIGGCA